MGLSQRICDKITGRRHRKKHQWPITSKASMVTARADGYSYGAIAKLYRTSKTSVYNIVKTFKERNNLAPKPRPGRPHKLTIAEERYIILQTKRHRDISWRALIGVADSVGPHVSISTIRRIVRKEWRRKWRSVRRIKLTPEIAAKRLRFARQWLPRVDELKMVIPPLSDPRGAILIVSPPSFGHL